MPEVAAVRAAEQPLIDVYRAAWSRIQAMQQALIDDPLQATKVRWLREMQRSIAHEMARLDPQARHWIATQLPDLYSTGAAAGAADMGGHFVWSKISQGAVERLAGEMHSDMLTATRYVEDSTKALIRKVAQDAGLRAAIEGQTAQQAAREMRRILASDGIAAIRYANGARHGLGEYAEMAIRTNTAKAYNYGTLNGAAALGNKWWEIFDGPDCGLTAHESGEIANGMIVDIDTCLSYPISHPNCRRGFGARPDITNAAQAKADGGSTTPEQIAAQRAQDAERAAKQERAAARRAGLDSSRADRSPAARLEKRAAKIENRAAVETPGHLTVHGRDGVSEEAFSHLDNDALRTTRRLESGGDANLQLLNKAQGYDGLPDVVSNEEMDRFVASGETELHRGVFTDTTVVRDPQSGELVEKFDTVDGRSFTDQYRYGEFHPGTGVYGNGTYTAAGPDSLTSARNYSSHGQVMRMSLKPDARVIDEKDLLRLQNEWANGPAPSSERGQIIAQKLSDPGRFATDRGYDAIRVPTSQGAGHDYIIVLNRTATRVVVNDVPWD